MKQYVILAIMTAVLNAHAQGLTNLTASLHPMFTNMSAAIQANTLAAWADYNRAVARSPEFKGVKTNATTRVVGETNGATVTWTTNTVTLLTTNRPPLSFNQFFIKSLQHEKVARIVEQQNQDLYSEMYRIVGRSVVDAWP